MNRNSIIAIALAVLFGSSLAWSASTPRAQTLKRPTADKGTALLMFIYTGDSPSTLFVQEMQKLKLAMQGYDKVVLLKHNELSPKWDLAEGDERRADVIDLPTKENLSAHLGRLADEGYVTDLYIVSRGRKGSFRTSSGTYGDNRQMKASEIGDMARDNGYTALPIRMVWSTLCYGSTLNDAFREAGAKVVAGARYTNFYPNQFGRFATAWKNGKTFAEALEHADTAASRTVVQSYLALIHAPAKRKEWGGCKFGRTILGSTACAKDYFTEMWFRSDRHFKDDLNGKENMNYASEKLISGNGRISRSSSLSWN